MSTRGQGQNCNTWPVEWHMGNSHRELQCSTGNNAKGKERGDSQGFTYIKCSLFNPHGTVFSYTMCYFYQTHPAKSFCVLTSLAGKIVFLSFLVYVHYKKRNVKKKFPICSPVQLIFIFFLNWSVKVVKKFFVTFNDHWKKCVSFETRTQCNGLPLLFKGVLYSYQKHSLILNQVAKQFRKAQRPSKGSNEVKPQIVVHGG